LNRTHPLFQFMPYGAPELLASEGPRLSRASLVGSGAMLASFAAAILVFPRGVEPTVVTIESTICPIGDPIRPLVVPPTPLRPATPKLANTSERGIIAPVVDPPPIEWPETPIEQGSEPTGSGAVSDGSRALPEGIESRGDVFPERGEFVHTDQSPVTQDSIRPEYPRFAQDAGIEGVVIVHALVGRDGRVIRVEVDEKRSELLLNEAAVSAARRWTFQPAMVNGHPVAVWVALTFKFILQ
jgi:protein TonB